jgi:hypothetical protein
LTPTEDLCGNLAAGDERKSHVDASLEGRERWRCRKLALAVDRHRGADDGVEFCDLLIEPRARDPHAHALRRQGRIVREGVRPRASDRNGDLGPLVVQLDVAPRQRGPLLDVSVPRLLRRQSLNPIQPVKHCLRLAR